MAFMRIQTPTPIAAGLIVLLLLFAAFLLFFGVANLIHPDVPDEYLTQNTLVCLGVCGLGITGVIIAVAIARGTWLQGRSGPAA